MPQRTLAEPYLRCLRDPGLPPGGAATVSTVGGLAQQSVELFWPLVAEEAGFAHPDRGPVFLTLETAQYYMARLVRPLLDGGFLQAARVQRPRLYSQILDNLNKAAVVGFPHTDIASRLKAAWVGEPAQGHIYDEAQECAQRFRRYCLEHNLLDFSLQLETFLHHVWPRDLCREYLLDRYRHLIYDNLEEDTPAAHDLLRQWLPQCQSALLVADRGAGYRRFLGADPESAYQLGARCQAQASFDDSFVTSPPVQALATCLGDALERRKVASDVDLAPALTFQHHRYQPQMLDWMADQVAKLVHIQGEAPGDIVILAPFLSDSLRFAISTRLESHSIPWHSHRPSRALRDEPASRCLLTLAVLAHPGWTDSVRPGTGLQPATEDVVQALGQAIEGLDLVRAHYLTQIVYRPRGDGLALQPFQGVQQEAQERITYVLGERYERLRSWLADYASGPPLELDHFLSRLFGEVLSQEGFGFHRHYDRGETAANLIESARKFRWVAGEDTSGGKSAAQEYLEMVQEGVVAAQYVSAWRQGPEDSVLLAPAYTFLLSNRPVSYQFWLDVGGRGWWERLYQPLTHPYVLSRRWTPGRPWTDTDEFHARQEGLQTLVQGLLRRCRHGVYLGLSQYGEDGFEGRGPLLQAVQRLLRSRGDVTTEIAETAEGG